MLEYVAQFSNRFRNSSILRRFYNIRYPTILYEVENENTGTSSGALLLDKKYFFKNIPQGTIKKECLGYRVVAPYYPTAGLVGTIYRSSMNGLEKLLLYEYIDEIDNPGMMLADVIDVDGKDKEIDMICELYSEAYSATYKVSYATAHDVFFSDRIKSRILPWYTPDLIDRWQGKTALINGKRVTIDLKSMIESLENYFTSPNIKEPTIISQGDTTEWNISTIPLILDYEAGGRIPIMAEAAVVHVMFSFYGDYLARRYNPAFFLRRGLHGVNSPTREDNKYMRTLSAQRMKFLARFTREILQPMVDKTGLTDGLKNAYRHYYLMKMLAVFNPDIVDSHDFLYILAKSQQMFDKAMDAKDMNDLLGISVS